MRTVVLSDRSCPLEAAQATQQWWLLVPAAAACAWTAAFVTRFETGVLMLNVTALAFIVCGFRRQMVVLGVALLTVLDGVTRSVFLTGGMWRFNTFNYVLLLLLVLYRRELLPSFAAPLRWLTFLLLLLMLGLLVSADVQSGAQHILAAAITYAVFVVLRQARMDGELWFRVAVTCGLAASAGMFVYYFGRGPRVPVNPNVLVLMPLTALFTHCLFEASAPTRGRRSSLALVVLSACNLMWVFLAGSRGGLLTALICVAFLLVSTRSAGQRLLYPLIGVTVSALLVAASPAALRFGWARVEKLLRSDRDLSERTSGRSEIAEVGWDVFVEHPLGIGTGAFANEFASLSRQSKHFQPGTKREAHSAWVKILAENGIPGILVMAAFVASFAFSGIGRPTPVRNLAVFTSAALAMAFLSTEFAAKSLWFLAAGCAVLLAQDSTARSGVAQQVASRIVPVDSHEFNNWQSGSAR